MRLYKKEYKYLNTETAEIETFRVYNFLDHIRDGVKFTKTNLKRWVATPFDSITFKLEENDTTLVAKCAPSRDQYM